MNFQTTCWHLLLRAFLLPCLSASAGLFVSATVVSAQWVACSNGSTTCTTESVGVGTTSPGSILDIEGNGSNVVGNLLSGSSADFSYFAVGRTSPDFEIGAAASPGQFFNDSVAGAGIIKAMLGPIMIGVSDNQPTITITNGGQSPGNVGIGTVAPVSALTVLSSATDGQATFTNGIVFVNNADNFNNTPWTHAAIWSQGSAGFNGSLLFGTDGDGAPDTTGITERMRITPTGNVGIGTTDPQYPLSVNGTIQAKEVIVNAGWSDYVFDAGYSLQSLESIASYIKVNHRLPGMPSAAEVQEHGVSIGDIESKLLAKVEELTLHMIRLENENEQLRRKLEGHEAAITVGPAASSELTASGK